MDERLSSAREDLSLIRSMLAQTMTGLRGLAGFFTAYGWIWLGYGTAVTAMNAVSSALHVPGTTESWRLSYHIMILGGPLLLALYAALGVTFFRWRRLAKREGLNALARKLLDVWGVCLGVFVCVSLFSDVVVSLMNYVFVTDTSVISGGLYVSRVLWCLFPTLPLLLTAAFAENKGMLALGLAALAFGLARMAMPFDWLSIGVTRLSQLAWAVPAWLVLQGFPGLLLLAFGHLLKRDEKHGAA